MIVFNNSLSNSLVDPGMGTTALGDTSGTFTHASSILISWHSPFPCIKWVHVISLGLWTVNDSKRDTSEFH